MAERPPSDRPLSERLDALSLRQLEMEDVKRFRPVSEDVLADFPWRDHGTASRVERVWGRLSGSLRARRRAQGPRALVAASAAAAVFGVGVWFGRTTLEAPADGPSLVAERVQAPEPPEAEPERDVRERSGRPSAAPIPGPRRAPRGNDRARNRPTSRIQHEQEEPPPVVEFPSSRVVPVIEVPGWLSLAERGEYAAAFQAVDQVGGFDAVVTRSSAEELMSLADVARAAGQQGRAIQALRRVVQLYPDDPNAPVAAMLLGNLLHRAGDAKGAREAYALNRSLSPQGDFAEDALAREFEVALEAADIEQARVLATQYEREFPEGRRLGEIREQLSRAERDRGPSDGSREGSLREEAGREGAGFGVVREGTPESEESPEENEARSE